MNNIYSEYSVVFRGVNVEWQCSGVTIRFLSKIFYCRKVFGYRGFQKLSCNIIILKFFVHNTVHICFNILLTLYILTPTYDKAV
jgi:hypothetical protein